PFAVNILRDGINHCTGSIIARRWILTAAHCVRRKKRWRLSVSVAGSTHAITSMLPIKQVYIHPRNIPKQIYYDATLIELHGPLLFSSRVQPIRLARNDGHFRRSQMFTVVGWSNYNSKHAPSSPRQISVPLGDMRICQRLDPGYSPRHRPYLCMGYHQGQHPCKGDSGGPLVVG
ncbi:trypsin-like cysteine/serine peptidase domain-containing protein, partial [Syncephalis pseudoplumigaleata]